MSGKKRFRVKGLAGTPFFISVDEKLGRGSYGEVYRAYSNDQPNLQLVVKIISLENEHNLASVESELAIIRELPHQENLVNCLRVHVESSHNLYIIMEYCNGGSLENYLKSMVLMPEQQIWEMLKQIAKGYRVLHDASLIHRDIKPENILIHNGTFKLADFGLSRRINNPSLEQNISMKGSPLYMAPELVERSQGCSKVDVFSLGCVLYQLAYDGDSPFYTSSINFRSREDYFEHVKTAELILKQKNKKGQLRSLQLRQLISYMLEKDSSRRISWEQIFAHGRIKLNQIHATKHQRTLNNEEKQLNMLKISLIQVGRSSAKLEQLPQKQNVRQASESLTLELVEFEQIMGHQQLRELEHLMYRCKITTLTVIHANHKLVHLLVGKKLHPHLKQQLNKLILEGFLFLQKVNILATARLEDHNSELIAKLRIILNADRGRILEQFKKFSKKQLQEEESKAYDLRRYQNELYGFLTQYCDFPTQLQNRVRSVMALLVDIYDSALKLIELALNNNVGEYQIETSMDAICWGKLQPQHFHEYLLGKEHTKEDDIRGSLKQLGLLFE